jgi:hypothetical protein
MVIIRYLVGIMTTDLTEVSNCQSHGGHIIASKSTTQRAPLERLLTYLRTRKILPFVRGACVLDFGCGLHLRTLRAVGLRTSARYGIDSAFTKVKAHKTTDGIGVSGSFSELKSMLASDHIEIDCIVSLACFEHLDVEECQSVLRELHSVSTSRAILVGTVPTPPAKPVLEFLSYRLGLIDRSQIEDHKIYYDKAGLQHALLNTGWQMAEYKTFQFGMNSFFKLVKSPF